MTNIDKLTVTVTPTSDGSRAYMQVISSDQFTVNVVLIADAIKVFDTLNMKGDLRNQVIEECMAALEEHGYGGMPKKVLQGLLAETEVDAHGA